MQQYKYIKGSAEDFVGAPSWALESVWCDKGGDQMVYWLNKERGLAMMPLCHVFEWNGSYGYRCFVKAQREPIPEWNGDGLPPVGCDVEYLTGILGKSASDDNKPPHGQVVKVSSHEKYEGNGGEVVVATWFNSEGAMRASVFAPECLRPLRTEAERKREGAVNAIQQKLLCRNEVAVDFYEHLAAGKIPGIKLES